MITTLTEAECRALTIRGDVPGVLDGYVGPVRWGQASAMWAYVGMIQDCHYAASGDDGRHDAYVGRDYLGDAHQGLFLPLANPLVQAHLVGWLGRGTSCPDFDGNSHAPVPDSPDQPPFCPRCRDTGYLRSPHNRYGWLTPKAHGGLPDWIRLALIWGSVVRAAAGMEPILGVYGPREGLARRLLLGPGWTGAGNGRSFEADHAILSRSEVYIDETPAGRVIRFEVPDGST